MIDLSTGFRSYLALLSKKWLPLVRGRRFRGVGYRVISN